MIKACTLNTAKEALFHFIQIGCISIVPLRMCRSNTSEDNTRGGKKKKNHLKVILLSSKHYKQLLTINNNA